MATAHPISTAIGRSILHEGGNAYDAALAVSAALPVVAPHCNGLGADLFAVVRGETVETLNASGPAADLATPERFERDGFSAIPGHGPLASFMVPGLVAAWSFFAERGTMRLKELLAPAIRWARVGVPVTPHLASAIAEMPFGDNDWLQVYSGHQSRSTLRQAELAGTLEEIARDGGHGFYHGGLARAIERDMIEKGGLLRFEDLDRYQAIRAAPLRCRYRGQDVYTTPPNSQGATALYWLARLERHSLRSMSPSDYVVTLVDTMYSAYEFRARRIGDPDRMPLPKEWLEIESSKTRTEGGAAGRSTGGDTTAFSVFDGSVGLSVIQSNYQGFGSGHTVGETGINLNNRGSYFTLDRTHHNVVAPRKRTFHTLMATAVVGPELILLGSMGGDVQPQVNVQVLSGILDRGRGIQAAIDAPRFAYPASIYGSAPLLAEAGAGLNPSAPAPDHPSAMGHCQGIQVGAELAIGIDPRSEGRWPIPGVDPP
ncbi:MAG: gamma-glutamyltransferase [Thermoplasmata archaeon]|nr:gamma-glutamyltransferase [Thermoplasmata archaeon]